MGIVDSLVDAFRVLSKPGYRPSLETVLAVTSVFTTLLLSVIGIWLAVCRATKQLFPFCLFTFLPAIFGGVIAVIALQRLSDAGLNSNIGDIDWTRVWLATRSKATCALVGLFGTLFLYCISLV